MKRQPEDFSTYYSNFLTVSEASSLFDFLSGLKELTTMMEMKFGLGETLKCNFGKLMFIDKNLKEENRFPEANWGKNRVWPEEMKYLKARVEELTGWEYKTCVCIYYPDGNSGVEFHSDNPAFGDTGILPSLSLGEERYFSVRDLESKTEHSMLLKHGSLLVMNQGFQEYFEHALPTDPNCKNPRINITFRKYGFD